MILRAATNVRGCKQLTFAGSKNNIILNQIIIDQLLIRGGFLISRIKNRPCANKIVKSQNLTK